MGILKGTPEDPILDREIARMDFEASRDQAADRLRFQNEIGLAAIKALTVVNGGAILALLTFIGNRPATYDAASLKGAFAAFCIGLTLALASCFAGYYSQGWLSDFDTTNSWNYQRDMKRAKRTFDGTKEGKWGYWLLVAAGALATLSLMAFAYGGFAALNGIL